MYIKGIQSLNPINPNDTNQTNIVVRRVAVLHTLY